MGDPESVVDCKDSEQTCTFSSTMLGHTVTAKKCFPSVCKEENIAKALGKGRFPPVDGVSFDLSCAQNATSVATGPDDLSTGLDYLSEECRDLLSALEKEANETGRNHESDPSDPESVVDCK